MLSPRLLLAAGLLGTSFVIARPPQLVLQDGSRQAAPRRLQGRFLHITDLHPDEFYKVHASTDEGSACHRGSGVAGTYGAETSDCDSPYSLINATFDWIEANLKDEIDFVIWTGDSARHDSDEEIARAPAQVLNSNRMVASKFIDTFADPAKSGLTIPIIPTLGNNDILPHNILLPGPNKWLQYYTDIWSRFIPEDQKHVFEFGGYFSVEVIPNKLAVFSLNTLYFFDRNVGVDDCVSPSEPGFKQMEWLRIQLQFLRQRGMKAILIGHVPPARTESKMLWDETCWQKYTLWLRQYRDVVVSGLYGHMNIDHFLLQDTKELNYDLMGASWEYEDSGREPMEDEMSTESKADYLQELRAGWTKLPKPRLFDADGDGDELEQGEQSPGDDADGSKKKPKKPNHPKKNWGDRYQLSLVSPSIVPNYFPTLRVVEYNISGLEESPVWIDEPPVPEEEAAEEEDRLELRDPSIEMDDTSHDVESFKKKKKKHKKPKKPKDPSLVIPDPPAKGTPPGPAYSPQPLTLTGYTQYYANLTHINNDIGAKSDQVGSAGSWDPGKHHGKEPKQKPAAPRTFKFEVEYTTFKDKLFNLTDLTVNSFAELAYRMGQKTVKGGSDEIIEADDEGEVDAEGKKRKKKKKKKKRYNKIWIHFLRHAFVSTVSRKELEEVGR